MKKLILLFTFFFSLIYFYQTMSGSEESLPTLKEIGGVLFESNVSTANASVISFAAPVVASKPESLVVINRVDAAKTTKKIDSGKVSVCPVSAGKKDNKKSLAIKNLPKPKMVKYSRWKDRKMKFVKMNIRQKKKLFVDLFGRLIVERCVAEGLADESVLSSEYAVKMYMDTSIHAIVLFSMPEIESGYNPFVNCSTSTAKGFYQFINSTGRQMCEELGIPVESYDPHNPYQNIVCGVHLYATSFKKFRSVNWAIGIHHDGEGDFPKNVKLYDGAGNHPFVKLVRGAMKTKYEDPPKKAYEQWQSEILSYNCLECIDYYVSLKDTTKIEIVDTLLAKPAITDTTMLPSATPSKKPLAVASRTFF
jgi:hypothetical protein